MTLIIVGINRFFYSINILSVLVYYVLLTHSHTHTHTHTHTRAHTHTAGRQVNQAQQAEEQKLARIFLTVAVFVLILIMFS